MRVSWSSFVGLCLVPAAALATGEAAASSTSPGAAVFSASDRCVACHNGLSTRRGDDVSFGSNWRASMMANAARDPYWQAAVRRETLDHPRAAAAIEDECSKCHMPMARLQAHADGATGAIFAHLTGAQQIPAAALAADGVSCAVCHRIEATGLGTEASFTGGFVIDTTKAWGERPVYGRFDVDAGRQTVMRSASGHVPVAADQVRDSELCATCHTLFTHALDQAGEVVGELPEQVPYLEWQHSIYRQTQSCQACHMVHHDSATPIAGVVGQPRQPLLQHVFRGGNFLVQQMLNQDREALGVEALPSELDAAVLRTVEHLKSRTAAIAVRGRVEAEQLIAEVQVVQMAGHKLPTAYPSRRVWIQLTVTDSRGRVVFDSGRLQPNGSIVGNDNDVDAARFEPHYDQISAPDQVQIYEAILADPAGDVTTGLLRASQYVKDNRLLPAGFDKETAGAAIEVHGAAASDASFTSGIDRVRYRAPIAGADGSLEVEATLWYQPIGFRWAENLRGIETLETKRFVDAYEKMAGATATRLATALATVSRPEP